MIRSGWHSVKKKCWNPDCINFNWILLTGKAIWYPIVNISRKEFLSLRCCLSWISDIVFLGLWKVNRRLTNRSTFLGLVRTSWILIHHKIEDILGSSGIYRIYRIDFQVICAQLFDFCYVLLVKVFIWNKIQLQLKLQIYRCL